MSLNTYISELRNSLNCEGAHEFYFPRNRDTRHLQNLRLARELAFGLKDFDETDVAKTLGSLYGIIVVAHSFDSTGVAIDAAEWLGEIRRNMAGGC